MQTILQNKKDLNFNPRSLPTFAKPQRVLMVSPTHFDVVSAINAHMVREDGSLNVVDKQKALTQWQDLKKVYEKLNLSVHVVEGVPNLPDMVFSANQSFPFVDTAGKRHAVLSNMRNDVRHCEVEHIAAFLTAQGYTLHHLDERAKGCFFESMGDAVWLPGHRFILGGFGFRTDKREYTKLAQIVDAPVAVFELKNEKFYHLDTCLSVLNSTTALACPEAFTEEGWELLLSIFETVLEVPLEEADSPNFACNAHCPDEKHVVIQRGCSNTVGLLKQHGFVPIEVDTSEYIKSGGSVFCMKLMFF